MGLKQCGHMPRERSDRRHCGHIQITGSGYIGAGVRLRRSESGVNHNQARVGVTGPTLSGLRGSSYPLNTEHWTLDGRTSLEDLGKDIIVSVTVLRPEVKSGVTNKLFMS